MLDREDRSGAAGALYATDQFEDAQDSSSPEEVHISEEHGSKVRTKSQPTIGARVRIINLEKKSEYNGHEGEIISHNSESNRWGICFLFEDKEKQVALQEKNFLLLADGEPSAKHAKRSEEQSSSSAENKVKNISDEKVNSIKAMLLADPEIVAMIQSDPKIAAAVEDCSANPLNAMKYLGKPGYENFIAKAMAKVMGGGRV